MDEIFGQRNELAMSNGKIRVSISHRKLWEEFHRNNNEMILTSKGRCIYPRIGYFVDGLEPKAMYLICLKICRTDRSRYKYTAGEWHVISTGEPENDAKHSIYPDNGSTQLGQYWMTNGIRFGKLKITNSIKDCSSNVHLTSMHKYRPILYIYKVYATPALCLDGSTILTNQYQLVKNFTDQIMEFIAVTAYQNQRIIEMKKIHNSYARGQRGNCTVKNSNNSTTTDNNDRASAAVSLTDERKLRLSISPLNKYKPYWTNRYVQQSVPLFSTNCNNPSSATATTICAITPCLSNLSTNHQTSSTTATPTCSINTLNDSENILPETFSNLSKTSTEQSNFLNPSNFNPLNLPTMWNYSTLWHHFSVPYPSLITHKPSTI